MSPDGGFGARLVSAIARQDEPRPPLRPREQRDDRSGGCWPRLLRALARREDDGLAPPAGVAREPDHAGDCQAILARLFLFLDHELGEEESAEVREHLEECAGCLGEYTIVETIKKLVARHGGGERPPAELRERILRMIRAMRDEARSGPSRQQRRPDE